MPTWCRLKACDSPEMPPPMIATCKTVSLVRRDAGVADDLAEALVVGGNLRLELRAVEIGRRQPDLADAVLDVRQRHDLGNLLAEMRDDIGRRFRRRGNAEPDVEVEARYAAFGD